MYMLEGDKCYFKKIVRGRGLGTWGWVDLWFQGSIWKTSHSLRRCQLEVRLGLCEGVSVDIGGKRKASSSLKKSQYGGSEVSFPAMGGLARAAETGGYRSTIWESYNQSLLTPSTIPLCCLMTLALVFIQCIFHFLIWNYGSWGW